MTPLKSKTIEDVNNKLGTADYVSMSAGTPTTSKLVLISPLSELVEYTIFFLFALFASRHDDLPLTVRPIFTICT